MDHIQSFDLADLPENTRKALSSHIEPGPDIVQTKFNVSRAWRLNCGHVCTFELVDEAVLGGKPAVGKGVEICLEIC